ncbi:hypothetical protein, partial [Moorena sp. SIO3I8]|uniref:hypothetical protein n=1 Tax=Moorena sp. SIO3I8 TaxID=2607833 RepID=UPI0025DF3C36
ENMAFYSKSTYKYNFNASDWNNPILANISFYVGSIIMLTQLNGVCLFQNNNTSNPSLIVPLRVPFM